MRTTARVRRVRDGRLEFSREWLQLRNPHAPIEVLTAEQVETIHDASMSVLEDVGMRIQDEDARKFFASAGFSVDHATERVAAAVEAARSLEFPFMLTARAENHIRGNPDLDDTIARLQAYERAGADVLFAPGLRDADQIRTVCEAVSKPVNVLARKGLTMAQIVDAGGQRVSVGGALTWVAANAVADVAERMRDEGDFSLLGSPARVADWLA